MLILNNKNSNVNRFVGNTKTKQDFGLPFQTKVAINMKTGKAMPYQDSLEIEFGYPVTYTKGVPLNIQKEYWNNINKGIPKYFIATDTQTLTDINKLRTYLLPKIKRQKILGVEYKRTGNVGFSTIVTDNVFVTSKDPTNKNLIPKMNSNKSPKRIISKTGSLTMEKDYPIKQTSLDKKDLSILPEKISALESINLKQSSAFPFHKKTKFQKDILSRLDRAGRGTKIYFDVPEQLPSLLKRTTGTKIETVKVVDEQTKPNDLTLVGILGILYYIFI